MTRIPAGRVLRAHYPYQQKVIARYADVDPLWHINNVAMAQYFEDTRISMLRMLLDMERMATLDGDRILLAHQSIDYLREGTYPGSLDVGAAVLKVGNSSVTIGMGLFQDEACIALSEAVLVRANAAGPCSWSLDERTLIDDPVWRLQTA
jgi:acyl-CoA thioester hydrolase